MTDKLDDKELVSFKELLIANSIQVDALAKLLIEKGLFTEQEFFAKLKQVQAEYQDKKGRTTHLESAMTSTFTLGSLGKRTQFSYSGNVKSGVTLEFKERPHVSARFFQAILENFKGQTVTGGFSMTNPKRGGFGEWVQKNSPRLNLVRLTPRHASFIAAVLEHEGYITSSLEGNTVFLHFQK